MVTAVFKKIADGAPTMIWSSDPQNRPQFYNKNWLAFRGAAMEDELHTDWRDVIFADDYISRTAKLNKSYELRKPYKAEYRLKSARGSYRWIVESGTPFFDDMNVFKGFIGSCIDINKTKEIEHQKDEFIVAASHELKTPLTSLSVYLHLIDEYFSKNNIGDYKSYVRGAILQLEKMDALITSLLDIDKITEGYLNYVWKNFHFQGLIEEVIDRARNLYPERDFQCSGVSSGYIRGDRRRLSDAIENLLNNAVKYSGCNSKIMVDVSEDDTHVQFGITDFGIGIDKEFHSNVFDRFFRIPGQLEQTYPGLGIGLYMTKQIIEKHNGNISVESEKDKYTRFTTRIPLIKSAQEN